MTLNDLEPPKYGFVMNFSRFEAATHISKKSEFAPKSLEIGQDNLRMKLMLSRVSFCAWLPKSFLLLLGSELQTPVIGSRYRASHAPPPFPASGSEYQKLHTRENMNVFSLDLNELLSVTVLHYQYFKLIVTVLKILFTIVWLAFVYKYRKCT